MSCGQTLRALVTARLTAAVTAAAEDIFLLFEARIAEYEEELFRFKGERRKLESTAAFGLESPGPGPGPGLSPGLNLGLLETPQIKEEPEEEQLSLPESSVCVKTEAPSLRRRRQREDTGETQRRSETSDTDDDDDWTRPISSSDGKSTGLFPKYKPAVEDSVSMETEEDTGDGGDGGEEATGSGEEAAAEGAEEKKNHQCDVCEKSFRTQTCLQKHLRLHRTYSCLLCNKTFKQQENLKRHQRLHSAIRPFSCSDRLRAHRVWRNLRGLGGVRGRRQVPWSRLERGEVEQWMGHMLWAPPHSPGLPEFAASVREWEDKVQTVESKIRDGIYRLQPKRGKSESWSHFNIVVDQEGRQMDYACCKTCNKIIVYSSKTGTSGLRRHVCPGTLHPRRRLTAVEHIETKTSKTSQGTSEIKTSQ